MSAVPVTRRISRAEIERRVQELAPWFHNLDLKGVQTAPNHFLHDYPRNKFEKFAHALPKSLEGKTVLDIGCNAGFYSIEMLRRGAARVVGIDSDDRFLAQARLVADVEGVDLELKNLSVYDIARLHERFDLVIFMGVLYHLRHPLLALDLIHEHVANDLMLFQTMQRGSSDVEPVQADYDFFETEHFGRPGYPKLHFIEHKYANDTTNWWAPNQACTEAMLRSSGFEILHHPEEEVYICQRRDLTAWESANRAVYPARGGSNG